MPKPLSMDLRKRVVAAYEASQATLEEVARRYSIGVATLVRLMALKRNKGTLEPKPHGGGQKPRLAESDVDVLKELVNERPDWTRAEYAKALEERIQKHVSVDIIDRAFKGIDYTYKKKRRTPLNKNRNVFSSSEPSI
jgi:transposase